LDRRALYAFDDFMIARYHMFVMVYFHQKSIAYEQLLKGYMQDPQCEYQLPANLDAYLLEDDARLLSILRGSSNRFARRIVEQRPYSVALEVHGSPQEIDISTQRKLLENAGFEVVVAQATGAVYGGRKPGQPSIYVRDRTTTGKPVIRPIECATTLFERYQEQRCISRLYVAGEEVARAREYIDGVIG